MNAPTYTPIEVNDIAGASHTDLVQLLTQQNEYMQNVSTYLAQVQETLSQRGLVLESASVPYTLAAGAANNSLKIDVPDKSGYTFIGYPRFYTGSTNVSLSGLNGMYAAIKNTSSVSVSSTLTVGLLYSRNP